MLGNWETGRVTIVIAPTITIRIEITMATIGRLMKNFDTLASSLARIGGDCFHGHALSHLHHSFNHDAFTVLQSFGDDPHLSNSFSYRNGAHTDLVVAPNNCDLITSLKLDHRPLGNQQGTALRLRRCANTSVSARTKEIVGIRKDARDPYGPSSGVYFAIRKVDSPRVLIDTAVGEQQL